MRTLKQLVNKDYRFYCFTSTREFRYIDTDGENIVITIPLSDVEMTYMPALIKGITLMKWIRRYIEDVKGST